MLDIFKEGADAWFQRIKSPIIGSVALSFIVLNWQPIFFVLFSDDTVLDRFAYYDANTSLSSLLIWPIVAGLLLGLATPFLNYFGSYAAKWPTENWRLLQAESANAVLTRKAEMAAEREVASAEFKEAALREARASQAIKDAELDDSTREELEEKLAKKAVDTGNQSDNHVADRHNLLARLTEVQIALLRILGSNGEAASIGELAMNSNANEILAETLPSMTDIRARAEMDDGFNELKKLGLTQSDAYSKWSLTSKGYEIFDNLER